MFCGTLHPYQEDAVNRAVERGSILLALDMGTGKTVIALAVLEELMGRGEVAQALIIVPASLRWQWAQRIAQFTDTGQRTVIMRRLALTVPIEEHCVVVDGGPAERGNLYRRLAQRRPDYVIAGYDTASSDWRELRDLGFDAIILDEAQAVKNPAAARTKHIRRLRAPYRFALTGTPMDNGKPEEIYSIMSWVDPEVFGRADLFDGAYVRRNPYGRAVGYRNLHVLHDTLAPAMVRYTCTDPGVAVHMPEVVHTRVDVHLDACTRQAYARVEADLACALEQAREEGGVSVDVAALYAGGVQNGGAALGRVSTRMLAARLLLCHPQLLHVSAAKHRAARKRSDPGSAYARALVDAGHLDTVAAGPKLDVLVEVVRGANQEPGAKVIVFTAFREMLPLLSAVLAVHQPAVYHGELDTAARASAIARFTGDPECRVLVSTDAGGSGLDLPVASHVVNYDPPAGVGAWMQRNTRHTRANSVHRRVHVIDLITCATIEEHVYTRLRDAHAVALAGVDAHTQRSVHTRTSLSAHLSAHARTPWAGKVNAPSA